jgi:predicted nucleic acid-binding protein
LNLFIVDASVVLKWIVPENGSADALVVRSKARLSAPELLMMECVNACWKYAQRREISAEEAILAVGVLERVDIELVSLRHLVGPTLRLSNALAHPAYDCAYLALALQRQCPFVTADEKLIAKVRGSRIENLAASVRSLPEVAAQLL